MDLRRLLLALAVSLGIGCSGSSSGDAAAPAPAPADACAEGFSADPDRGCVEIAAADACAPGKRPAIGKSTCVPVGTTTGCLGSVPDPSGWGCVDKAAPGPCDGATREAVDRGGVCVPIGDCSAAFPPAGAILVDASLSDAQVDATHFKKIGDAIAAAPAGATIAIERGTYAENLSIGKTLRLVGRCADEVHITEGSATEAGVLTQGAAKGVYLSGFTVSGHYGGIDVYSGSETTIEDVVVDGAKSFGIIADSSTATIRRSKVSGTIVTGNRGGWGISAGSSDVSVEDVNVVGGTTAIYAGTTDATLTVSRLVASGQAPQSPIRSAGVYARGGRITLERSVVHDIVGDAAVGAEIAKGMVEVRDTIMRDIKVGGTLARGYGAMAFNGGEVSVRGSTIARAESVGIYVRDSGSILNAYDTVVVGPDQSFAVPDETLTVSSERGGMGVQSIGGATLGLDDVAVIGTWGWAIYAQGGATLDAKHVYVDRVRPLVPKRVPVLPFAVGMSSDVNATITVDDVSILNTMLTAVSAGRNASITGKGLYVREVAPTDPVGTGAGIAVGDGGQVDLDASAIVDSTTSGVLATHGEGASIHLARSTIHGTRAAPQGFGHGVVVAAGATALLEGTSIFENAAIGVAAAGGRARVVSSVIARNPVALQVQDGSFIVESADDGDLSDNEVRISPDSRFVGNDARVGSGEIPLPSNVLP